jgi:hypothetical protein
VVSENSKVGENGLKVYMTLKGLSGKYFVKIT